jgi:signal transduction histidine kinase/DNA-binding response OmpR family regulator
MTKNNNILKGLIALLITFLLGYIGIIIIHKVFSNILNKVDDNVKNEYARYKIGEYILKEIGAIETKYYRMGVVTKFESLEPIQDEINAEIHDIKEAINVLQNGGVLEKHIKLNLIEASEVTDKIYFKHLERNKYTFEAIDLIPKLDELLTKSIEMEEIIKIRLSILNQLNKDISEDDIFKVKLFFKQLPTIFIRMNENAGRLLYDSKKNIEILEKDIESKKNYYQNLEYIFTYIVMFFIIVLSYFVIKLILRKNKDLEEITKKSIESEQEALKANETKSQFLANMSHEIRTPLNAIIGFSDILSESNLDNSEKEKATIISKSATALLNIINDILDISKIESGKFEISENEFNLNNLLEQLVQLYSVNTKQKDIRFLYTLDPNIPHFLISDETKIKQVLSNILSNAIKFTPQNASVSFKVNLKKIENNIATITFLVKDEGIGIAIDDQKKVFNPFSQADGTISRKFGGTGLGLSISSSIIKMLGSEIKLISKEGVGSTFYFDLDLKIQDIDVIDHRKLKYDFAICGVISDNENIRDHLISTVKYFGRIYQAEEDIENCKKVDLIFCFGDPEFTEKLTKRKKFFNCPVVFVGNKTKIQNHPELIALMDYYLDVPIYGSKIFNIMAQVKSIEESHTLIDQVKSKNKFTGKVLVAEDNTNNQLLIRIILEKFGLNVQIVENGKLALEKVKEEIFDLIFLDINMPVMDGIEAIKHIRLYEDMINKHTPVVALTANSIKGDREKYLEKGMDNYLSKPINNDELLKILNTYLNNEDSNIEINKDKLDVNIIIDKLGIDQEIAQILIDGFKENIVKDLDDMNEIIKNKNDFEICQKAHYIRNSCLNVGLDDICKLLIQLEDKNIEHREKEKIFELVDKNIKNVVK